MPDVTRIVETIFQVTDRASTPLQQMVHSSQGVAAGFQRASGFAAAFTGAAGLIGGALTLRGLLDTTNELHQRTQQIVRATDMSAESASSWVDVLETSGVEGHAIEQTFFSLSRRAAAMELGGRATSRQWQAMGINLRRGPEAALMRMAELAEQGRLSTGEMGMLLRVQGESAGQLLSVLQRGPQALRTGLAEAGQYGAIVTTDSLAMYREMRQSQREISDAWGDIQLIVGRAFMPVIRDLLNLVRDNMNQWIPTVQQFAQVLSGALRRALPLLLVFGKVFASNWVFTRLTGRGIAGWGAALGRVVMDAPSQARAPGVAPVTRVAGVFGRELPNLTRSMGQLGGQAFRQLWQTTWAQHAARGLAWLRVRSVAALAPALLRARLIGTALAATASRGGQAISGVFAPLLLFGRRIGAVFARAFAPLLLFGRRVGVAFARMLSAFGPAAGRIATIAARFFLIAAIAMFIWRAWVAISRNVNNIRGTLTEIWDRIQSHVMQAAEVFQPLIQQFTGDGTIGQFFDRLVPRAIEFLSTMVERIIMLITGFVRFVAEFLRHPLEVMRSPLQTFGRIIDDLDVQANIAHRRREQERQTQARAAATRPRGAPPPDRPGVGVHNDFRHSRFDIRQEFAEGFDPDRIAVAFSNDLAALGERRLQSGLSPLYAVR